MFSFFIFNFLCFLCLFVFAEADAVKSVSVMEEDSLYLDSGVPEIQRENVLTWTFGHSKTRIAKINKVAASFKTYDDALNGTFRGRLKLDSHNGSLTIMDTTFTDSGPYEVSIIGKDDVRFNVNVYARLPVPVITRNDLLSSDSKCVLLCSVVNVNAVSLSWYKGNSLLSSINVSDLNNISLHLDCLDDSYSCVINNSLFKQTTLLNNTVCHTCSVNPIPDPPTPSHSTIHSSSWSPSTTTSNHTSETASPTPNSQLILISAAAAAGSLISVTIVGIIWICKNRKKTDQKEQVQKQTRDDHRDDEVTYAAPTFYKKNAQKSEDEVVYAGIVTRR